MKCIQIIVTILLLFSVSIYSKQRKRKYSLENDVLEKSEVILKYPTYALKMPPIITSRKRMSSKVDPELIACNSQNVTKSLNDLKKQIKCIPRETLVEIAAPDGSKVVPNAVVVRRCGGICYGGKKCLPTRKTDIEFYVRSVQIKSGMVFCSRIKIPEDIECNCGCPKKKKCSIDQKFDPILCKCVCTNKEEEESCLEKAYLNFKWKAKDCTCGCRRVQNCTTGTEWRSDKCKCVKT